ncbi:MAG TPA: tryptophan--tRNA ligase, partial [Conexibacter sp.]|nr:tryptophan--tRNA ligase [Conexibacter sp.]
LIEILAVMRATSPEAVEEELAGARGYGDLKGAVGYAVVAELAPLQERYAELRPDEAALERILAAGAEQARELALPTLAAARRAMGVGPVG